MPGQGRDHCGPRPRDPGGVVQFKLPSVIRLLRYVRIKKTIRLRAVLAGQHLRPRRLHLPVLRGSLPHAGAHVRSRRAGLAGWPQGLGEHRHLLRLVQPPQGWPHARGGADAAGARRRAGPIRRRRSGSRSDCATRPTAGATTCTGTSSSTKPEPGLVARARDLLLRSHLVDAGASVSSVPSSVTYRGVDLTAVDPLRVIEGGRSLAARDSVCRCRDSRRALHGRRHARRVVFAAADRMAVEVPAGLDGGRTEVKVPWLPGATLYVESARCWRPACIRSTTRRRSPGPRVRDLQRIARAAGAGLDLSRDARRPARAVRHGHRQRDLDGVRPDGRLYVSSRFDGTVYRVVDDGAHEVVASDLGLACGLAFAPDGTLFVGDRSGTIFQSTTGGARRRWRRCRPASPRFISRWARTAGCT